MEDDDFFKVAPEDREFRRVRSLVKSRGQDLGRSFSVTSAEDGSALVRVRSANAPLLVEMSYGRARSRIDALYGFYLDDFNWFDRTARFTLGRRNPEAVGQRIIIEINHERWLIEFDFSGFWVKPLAEDVGVAELLEIEEMLG